LAKLFLFFIFAILAVLLIEATLKKIRKKERFNLSIATVIVLSAIVYFNYSQDKDNKKNFQYIVAFKQGATLVCNGIDIDNKDFNYVSGTSVFVAKEISEKKGTLIPLSECTDISVSSKE
jgi:K+ transporter